MTKLVKEKKKDKEIPKSTITILLEYLVAVFSVVLVVFLPVYLQDGYYKIGNAKYGLYESITKIALPVLLLLGILALIHNSKEWVGKAFLKKLSVLDMFVFLYLTLAVLSSLLSQYKDKVWEGYSGWFMGLYSQITFICIYFFLSRYAQNARAILFCLCATAGYVYLLGILNRFLIDPLGVYEGLEPYYILQFLSTLGQSSWYSAFVCTVMPMGIYFFWNGEKRWSRIAGGIFSFLGFSTLVTQNSDSAYIAFLCMMAVFFWFSVESIEKMERFAQVSVLFFASVKVMYVASKIKTDNMLGQLDTLSRFLINGNVTWILLGVSIVLLGILHYCRKKNVYSQSIMKKIRNVLYIILGIIVVFAVVCLILGAKGLLPANLQAALSQIPYLTWSDSWGNGRGFTWRFTKSMFGDMNWKNKLFGVGPECFPYYGYDYASADLNAKWGNNILTNAHNEWFTAVINYGLAGGIAYAGIFVSAAARFAKKAVNSPLLIGIIACIAAYAGHNVFCYQTVLCTPFIFLLMGIGEWYARKSKPVVS